MVNIHDIGYRLKESHWGKGIAYETSKAILDYAFENKIITNIYACCHFENFASAHIIKKLGLSYVSTFDYDDIPCFWFEFHKK